MSEARRTAGRPKRGTEVLNRTRIGEATVAALRAHGANGLTVSRIAAELDVRSQTLYHHMSTIGDAVNAARGSLLSAVDPAVFERLPWEEATVEFATTYYRAFNPLGQANSVFFLHKITDPLTLQIYEAFLHGAQAAGVSGERAMQLLLDIEQVIFSLIFEHMSWHALFDPAAIELAGAHTLGRLLRDRDASEGQPVERLRDTVRSLSDAARR
ncbi:TetR/AcrR family transcriptional regulator [Leucobacter sp. G161]|uniref:TetR/AcrR family transcriptional regulator n=1 Tax=Leucobacter sp. G161 TaxID=663704 RepID=UPI00073BB132|nr:TetR family transcriptional regulator [Leucobacter sp. G161]KUF07375.1 hypothetical protein AUL38_09640 [Leucobacter sp. G161]